MSRKTSFESVRMITVCCHQCGKPWNWDDPDLEQAVFETTDEAIEALEQSYVWTVSPHSYKAGCPDHPVTLSGSHVRDRT